MKTLKQTQVQKWAKDFNRLFFFQRSYTNGQCAYEKMANITIH